MKTLLLSILFLVGPYQDRALPPKADVEAVLTYVLNHTELIRFINLYVETHDVLYFRFGPSPIYTDQELKSLKDIVVKVKNSPPLIYDAYQDETQKPFVTVQILKMTQDTAEVRIGFPIQGAVGKFTLIKKGTWIIAERDVYQI